MAQTNFLESAIYQDALAMVNFRMDAASERNVEIFGQPWYTKHFSWADTPKTQSEFKTLLGQLHLDIAASTINANSQDPVRAIDGFGELAQEMLTFAHTYKLEAEDLRTIATYQKLFGSNDKTLNYIVEKLWNVRTKAINGINERLDIIIMSALSNDGSFTFTSTNDPNSPFVGSTIGFGFDSSHAGSVTTGWTDTNKATVDVMQDLMDVCDEAEIPLTKVLMRKEQLLYMLGTTKLKTYINGSDNASKPITVNDVNKLFEEIGLPIIEIVQKKSRTQNGSTFNTFVPWTAGKLLFVPDDKFGTIESMFSDKEMGLVSPNVDYSNYGRIEVMNWKKGEADGTNYTEFTKAKATCAPSISEITNMYTLNVTPA